MGTAINNADLERVYEKRSVCREGLQWNGPIKCLSNHRYCGHRLPQISRGWSLGVEGCGALIGCSGAAAGLQVREAATQAVLRSCENCGRVQRS